MQYAQPSLAKIKLSLDHLADDLWKLTQVESSTALLSGKAGIALFYGHLYLFREQDKDFHRFTTLLQQSVRDMFASPVNSTLSNGYTGILWVVRHFGKLGLLNNELQEEISLLEEDVFASLQEDTIEKEYDLLHGLLGKAMYFLECWPQSLSVNKLENIVDRLESMAVHSKAGICWKVPAKKVIRANCAPIYDLGMAHGIPSIISFLSKAYQNKINPKKTKVLLEKAIAWLLTQQYPSGKSVFPSLQGQINQSRLAWCYGDLGPALALFHASQALQRNDWQVKAIEVALHATERRIADSGIWQNSNLGQIDTCFCHGTSGLAHIFYRFYQVTNYVKFRQAANYWLNLTLDFPFAINATNKTGYKFPLSNSWGEVYWGHRIALLEGLAGVGLVLLSSITLPSYWDSLFQTDIQNIS